MSLSDITIYRHWNVVNGYVAVPHNLSTDKTRLTVEEALTAISGSTQAYLTGGSGPLTGSKTGAQTFIRLPGVQPGEDYSTNPVDLT